MRRSAPWCPLLPLLLGLFTVAHGLDGTSAPPTTGALKRKQTQLKIQERIRTLKAQMDAAEQEHSK